MQLLSVVADTFYISGRLGTLIVPGPRIADLHPPASRRLTVELHRPNGTVLQAEATLGIMMGTGRPSRLTEEWVVSFPALTKADIPIGTRVYWCPTAEGADGPSGLDQTKARRLG